MGLSVGFRPQNQDPTQAQGGHRDVIRRRGRLGRGQGVPCGELFETPAPAVHPSRPETLCARHSAPCHATPPLPRSTFLENVTLSFMTALFPLQTMWC